MMIIKNHSIFRMFEISILNYSGIRFINLKYKILLRLLLVYLSTATTLILKSKSNKSVSSLTLYQIENKEIVQSSVTYIGTVDLK